MEKNFTEQALRTESRPEAIRNLSRVAVMELLGLITAAGQVADTAKRAIFYGKPLDRAQITAELGALAACAIDLQGLFADGDDHVSDSLVDPNLRLLHVTLGVFSESGELAEALSKQMHTGNLDMVNVAEELADVDWYKQIGHDETGVSEADARAKLIAKLQTRYPEKFTVAAALNRDLDAERAVLETTTA